MLKILLDFEVQTDHLLFTRRQELGLINKKKRNCYFGRCCRLGGPQSENKRQQKVFKNTWTQLEN